MSTRTKIKINSLSINFTGGYTDQYTRPYETMATGHTIRDIEQCVHGSNGGYNSGMITGQMLGSVATSFVRPQANPGNLISIAYGWENPRLTFVMEVEISNSLGSTVELIQGYSDYNDPSYSGQIDPRCRFFINSITKLRSVKTHTPYGWENRQTVSDAVHVIANNDWTDIKDWTRKNNGEVPTNMRPQDIYSVLTVPEYVRDSAGHDMLDFRNTRSSQAMLSRRGNNLSTDYVGRILQGYANATSSVQGMDDNVFSVALGDSQEPLLSRDAFVAALDQLTGGIMSSSFTFQDLLRMDPTVTDRMAVYVPTDTQMGPINWRNHSEVWTGSGLETQGAAILSNGIPSIMMSCGMCVLAFIATNHDQGGPKIIITDAKMYGGGDASIHLPAVKARIQRELLDYIACYGEVAYDIQVRCLITQDIEIMIGLNGMAPIPFVNPVFADATMSPVLANNKQRLDEVASDFSTLLSTVIQAPVSLASFDSPGSPGFSI